MIKSNTRPFKHDYAAVMAKYPGSMPTREIAKLEGISPSTLHRNIKRFHLRPVRAKKRTTLKGSRREMLQTLLEQINDLRHQDISGPEACGAITDIIFDYLERM